MAMQTLNLCGDWLKLMKIEYLDKDGDPRTPLIRLYDFTSDEAKNLKRTFLLMASGSIPQLALHGQEWISPIAGCSLWLRFDPIADKGVSLSRINGGFECVYTSEGWLELADKIEPFIDPSPGSSQWLTNEGSIDLLISPDGRW